MKNAAAAPFAVVLSFPLCVARASLIPLAYYAIFASAMLLVVPYGKTAAALALLAVFPAAMYLDGLFARTTLEIVLTLISCALPVVLVLSLPEKLMRRAKKTLLF